MTYNPTLAYAHFIWFFLVSFPAWRSFLPTQHNRRPQQRFNRFQRRRFTKMLRPLTQPKPLRYNAGIRANGLHRQYPLRLRKLEHFIPSKAPTLATRANSRHLLTLHNRSVELQHRVQRLRTRRSPYSTTVIGQKGEAVHVNRNNSNTPRAPSPHKQRYCPMPAVSDPNAFAPAAFTSPQRQAAHTIASHVYLVACTTSLQMALQAPMRLRNPMGPSANLSPIV